MTLRVLIVDDSPAMRHFIRRTMAVSGIEFSELLEASNGNEALVHLRRTPVDIILTDINMPAMSGEELLREIEADGELRHIPTLVISTDATELRVSRMLALGAQGYIAKPFTPEMLRAEIERVLQVCL
ncbi:MAG: response regulator [Bryobacteraceae bacterium]|jgi:two-component system chemotaxis response regulator CheY